MSEGLFKHLIYDYNDRYTSEEMFSKYRIPLVPGTLGSVVERTGNVASFVECMVKGLEDDANNYAHEMIYSDL